MKNDFLIDILQERGMSPDDFFRRVSFSRSTFYRCFKNNENGYPSFKLQHIAEMASVLSLSYQECKHYFGVVPESLTDHVAQRNTIIQEIFDSGSPLDGKKTNSEFEFYDEATAKNKFNLTLLSVTDTANKIVKSIWEEKEECDAFYHYKLTIKLYNCSNLSICSLLSRLFYSIEKSFFDSNKSFRLKVMHYIPNYSGTSSDALTNSLELLKQTLPLHAFCSEYEQVLEPLSPYAWSNGNDMCVIKYSRLLVNNKNTIEEERGQQMRDQVYEHFLIKFAKDPVTNAFRAFATRLGEPLYLYKFFTCDTRLISQNEEMYPSILKTSKTFLKVFLANPSMLIGTDFCFDNIHYRHWKQLINEFKDNPTVLTYLQKVFHISPSMNNASSMMQYMEILIDSLKLRYDKKSHDRDIFIIWEEGLRNFVERKMINDLLVDGTPKEILNSFHFKPDSIIEILQEFIECIENQKNGAPLPKQRLYILKSNSHGDFRLKYSIIQNYGINIIADKAFSKNISSSFLKDDQGKELSEIFYKYWIDKINNRNSSDLNYSSDIQIMSDTYALSFIKSLIDTVITG